MTGDGPALDPAPPGVEPRLRDELHALYGELDAEVARLGPVCRLSGRCCRFEEYGHTLFASTPEIQLLLGDAPPPSRPLDRGRTCPWQDRRGRCTARDARPLGCRVYYCDPSYESSARELSERFIARLKQLADRHGLPWNYAPLHQHLHREHSRGGLRIEIERGGPESSGETRPSG